MTRHKTIGQDTPFLTYAIFTRIAARKAKEDRRKLLRKRINASLRTVIYNLTGWRSHASEDAVSIEDENQNWEHILCVLRPNHGKTAIERENACLFSKRI